MSDPWAADDDWGWPAPHTKAACSGPKRADPNGVEALEGESESEYVARQTRLREEARLRMVEKFGSTGAKMGGISSGVVGSGVVGSGGPSGRASTSGGGWWSSALS